MKKFLALTLAAGFALASAIGCSSTPSTSKPVESTKKDETKTIKGNETKTETKTEVKVTPETKVESKTETKTETKPK